MALADLIYTIAGDSSKFIKALQAADKQLVKTTANMSQMGKIGATISAGLATTGTAVLELARQSAQDMAEIQKIADATGASTEQLSKLGYTAGIVGLQLDDLRDAAFEVALKMGEAARGEKPATEAFANIGVAVKDASGELRDSGEVMDEAIKKLASIEHPATRAAAAAALLGDDVSLKMAPLLAKGTQEIERMNKEATDLGLVFDETGGKSAAQFQANLKRLQGAAEGIGRYLVQVFSPALNEMAEKMVVGATKTGELEAKQQAAKETMRAMLVVITSLGSAVDYVTNLFSRLGSGIIIEFSATFKILSELLAFMRDIPAAIADGGDALEKLRNRSRQNIAVIEAGRTEAFKKGLADRDRIYAEWQASVDRFMGAGPAEAKTRDMFVGPQLFMGPVQPKPEETKPEGPKPPKVRTAPQVNQAAQNAAAEAERVLREMQESAQAIFEETRTSEERAAQQFALRMAEIQAAQTAKLIDAETAARAITQAEAERDKEKLEALAELQERAQDVRESLMSESQKLQAQLQDGIANLNELLAEGAIDQGVYAQAVQKLNEELDPATRKMREMAEAGQALTDQMRTPSEALSAELERINALLAAGTISAETYDRALNGLFPAAEASLTAVQQLSVSAATGLADAFQQFLFDPFNANLGDLVKNFASAMAQLVTEMLAKRAVLALFGGATGAPPGIKTALSFAEGGYVAGPGTATSDSIPARLSNGEYVMPAATVRHFGRDFMDGIRAMRPQREAPVARFAEGGYVQGGQGTGAGVRVVNVVDSSMVQDFLTSSEGERVILNTIRRNRRQVSQVMA